MTPELALGPEDEAGAELLAVELAEAVAETLEEVEKEEEEEEEEEWEEEEEEEEELWAVVLPKEVVFDPNAAA